MISGYTLGESIGIGDFVGELDFKTVVVEEVGIFLLHLRQFQVVSGDDTRNGECRNGLEEQPGAVELVERVGTLQYLVKDDKRMAVLFAGLYESVAVQH